MLIKFIENLFILQSDICNSTNWLKKSLFEFQVKLLGLGVWGSYRQEGWWGKPAPYFVALSDLFSVKGLSNESFIRFY